ncbi:MAG: protein kinase [Clostridium sp.]|uniref:protein kinase n=1 Tax=Clostridium chrysemydis TaxID=2665504 RepID=UPI003EE58965
MRKNYAYSADFDLKTEKLLKDAKYLGQGNNGIVYELPHNRIIKIFLKEKICKAEGMTLKRTKKSKYFPKIYFLGELYIIREKVEGVRLDKYIKRNGLDKEISKKLYDLLKEFKKLGFVKLDTRCRDIYVTKDRKLMMIDPKGCYTRRVDFPRHLMKKLNSLKLLEVFLTHIEEIDEEKSKYWRSQLDKYFKKKNIEYEV